MVTNTKETVMGSSPSEDISLRSKIVTVVEDG
jgi:hypothetical protein